MNATQRIVPALWFDDNAEVAVDFYTSIFKNSKVLSISRYTEAGYRTPGSVLAISFELDGLEYAAINGGPVFKFTPAISLMVKCDSQDEVDYYWDKLLVGGEASQCGWLTDKFGVSWQIVPQLLLDLLLDKDTEKVTRVTQAMLQMIKLDSAVLLKAYEETTK